MPVTKRTPDLLNIRSVSLKSAGVSVLFDRPSGKVVMTELAGIIPFRRTVLPLNEIATAQVRKIERYSGRITYGVVLRSRRSVPDVKFNCTSREDAMNVAREISSFLENNLDVALTSPAPAGA